MKHYTKYKSLQQFANAVARNFSCGSATEIVPWHRIGLVKRIEPGHRKNTTGEYVPNAYLCNFGWKNTFYQHAVTVIGIPDNILEYFGYVADLTTETIRPKEDMAI